MELTVWMNVIIVILYLIRRRAGWVRLGGLIEFGSPSFQQGEAAGGGIAGGVVGE